VVVCRVVVLSENAASENDNKIAGRKIARHKTANMRHQNIIGVIA